MLEKNNKENLAEIPERKSIEREITLENLTDRDLLKAITIWYKHGNKMLNLADRRWDSRRWELYQKNPEKFFKEEVDTDITAEKIKKGLPTNRDCEHRIGFKIGKFGDYGYVDAKLRIYYNKEDSEKKDSEKRIQFFVDTNDIDIRKECMQANYLLAKKITEEWKKAGLPVYEKFDRSLSEEEKQEILEIEKNSEELKKFWEKLSSRKSYEKEALDRGDEEEEKEKRKYNIKE